MGVEWHACHICNYTFHDCGFVGHCNGCSNWICEDCFNTQSETYEVVEDSCSELVECSKCTKSIIRDDELVEFLLEALDVNREQAEDIYRLKHLRPPRPVEKSCRTCGKYTDCREGSGTWPCHSHSAWEAKDYGG